VGGKDLSLLFGKNIQEVVVVRGKVRGSGMWGRGGNSSSSMRLVVRR
jgi:hypothetical protein